MAKKKTTGAAGDYAIGRGKPLVHSRFQPGQSGNPGGRKKGSLNVKTIVQAVLAGEIDINQNGRRMKGPMLQALTLSLSQQGLRGSVPAIRYAIELAREYCDVDAPDEDLAEDDALILERGMAERRASGKADPSVGRTEEADDE
jgi:hypothetical protein